MPGTRYTNVAKSSWPYLSGVLRGIDADLTELENSAADSTRLNRTVWAVGDSLTQGIAGLSYDSNVAPGIGQPLLHYMAGSWETWALLASEARWTFGGIFATGSYTAAQILSVHVPQLLQVAQPGDTVVVLAGTNGNVLADVKAIHATLHAARLRTVAATIPPVYCGWSGRGLYFQRWDSCVRGRPSDTARRHSRHPRRPSNRAVCGSVER